MAQSVCSKEDVTINSHNNMMEFLLLYNVCIYAL